jgi:hypothetical protein
MMWLMLFREALKVAVTLAAPETVHVIPLVDLQPVHVPKVNPVFGVAVRITVGELVNCDWQEPVPKLEQLIPFGVLVTTPMPPPAMVTVTWSNPGTNPTQPTQVIIEITTTTGIRAFPKLDMVLPSFTGSHFDEKAAELVGSSSVSACDARMPAGEVVVISFTCAVMLIFEQSQVLVMFGLKPTTRIQSSGFLKFARPGCRERDGQ